MQLWQLSCDGINQLFYFLQVVVGDGTGHKRTFGRWLCCQIPSDNEEYVLYACQVLLVVFVFAVGDEQPCLGIEFIYCAVSFDA